MRPTGEAVLNLSDSFVDGLVERIRGDAVLGRGTSSSWEEVTPKDYEARERVRELLEEGVVAVAAPPTLAKAVVALRAFEASFWGT